MLAAQKVNPGQQVNIVHGLRQDINVPFFALQKDGTRLPLQPFPTVPGNSAPASITTSLTLCATWSELLAEYYSIYSIPECCCSDDVRNASAFALQPGKQAAAQKAVADHLGIPPEYADDDAYTSFALVRMTKPSAKATFDPQAPGVAEAKVQVAAALSKLPPQLDPAQDFDANPYLEFFQSHGTHFVSEVQLGDIAMQAFVFPRDVLDTIKFHSSRYSTMGPITDTGLIGLFRAYTKRQIGANSGFTLANTKVATASHSTAFETNIVPKLKDAVYDLPESIFMLYTSAELQSIFSRLPDVVPIMVKLTDITTFLDPVAPGQQRSTAVTAPFCNLLDAAVLQKFGIGATRTAVDRTAMVGQQPDYATMYKPTLPELVTTAATSVVGINQMYFLLDNINQVCLMYNDEIKDVQVFSDVIEVQSSIVLPGENATLISRLLMAAPAASAKEARYPVVTLASKDAFDNFKPIAEKMLGTMAVEGPIGSGLRRTLCNGASLINQASGPGSDNPVDVVMEAALNNTYIGSAQLADYNVQLGIQTTLLVAENVLNYRFNEVLAAATLQYATWIRTSLKLFSKEDDVKSLKLPDDVAMDLVTAYTRVSLLVTAPVNARKTLAVPRLTYSEYETAIQRMTASAKDYADALSESAVLISNKKAQEATSQLANALNKNVQSIGQFLLEQNKAQAAKERDVSSCNNDIMEKQRRSIADCIQCALDLQGKMKAQIGVMETAKAEMMDGLKKAEKTAQMDAVVGLVGAMAGLLAGSAAGLATDFSKLGEAYVLCSKVEKLAKVVEAFSKVWSACTASDRAKPNKERMARLNEGLASYSTIDEKDNPTDLDWNNFDANVARLAGLTGASTMPQVSTWVAETKKMSNIGRAITANSLNMIKLQYDLLLQGWQKDISDKQVTRLQLLETKLQQPDLPKQQALQINLFELGTLLEARANRTTLKLLHTLALQDAALQYAYFQEPAQIAKAASLNIHDVHELLDTQANNTIIALSHLPTPSDPPAINFVLPAVSIRDLLSDRKYTFSISTNNPAIPEPYERVRINYIEVQFTNTKPSTTSGELAVVLDSSLEFSDRAPDNTTRDYTAMLPSSYTYVYDLSTSATTYSNKPTAEFQGRYMAMTPFTTWTLSLPNVAANAGLTFPPNKLTTEITIRFYCNAIYNTTTSTPRSAPCMLALSSATSALATVNAHELQAGAHAMAVTRDVPVSNASPDAHGGGFVTSFDNSIVFDGWVDMDDPKKTEYRVNVELGPQSTKFEISASKDKVHVTNVMAQARLYPMMAIAGPQPALPPACFQLDATFDCLKTDEKGGMGFQYDSPSGSVIKVLEVKDDWKKETQNVLNPVTLKTTKVELYNQDNVEHARCLIEKAVAYYFTQLHAGKRVLVQAAPEDVVTTMTAQSVMGGWDVICTMDADKISALLEDKWNREKPAWEQNPEQHDADPLSTVYKIHTDPQSISDDTYISLDLPLGPPLISFVSNQPGECSFSMEILSGGTLTTYKTNGTSDATKTTEPISAGAAVVGIVTLSALEGDIEAMNDGTGMYGVYIDLGLAAFKSVADLPSLRNEAVSLVINTFFKSTMNYKRIRLGVVKTKNYSIPALTPKQFYVTTVKPDLARSGVLILFITTTGKDGDNKTSVYKLAYPLMSPYTAALFINSKILFQDMLLNQVSQGLSSTGGEAWCEAVEKPGASGIYIIQGKQTYNRTIGHLEDSTVMGGSGFYNPVDRAASDLRLPVKGAIIQATGDQINTTWDYDFQVDMPMCVHSQGCEVSNQTFHLEVPISPLKPTINPENQVVTMGKWALSREVEISGPGVDWYERIASDKSNMINTIKDCIHSQFQGLSIQLPDVSVFAVSNLLFPNDQILDLKQVHTPGDLLIVGDVKDPPAPSPPATTAHTAAARGIDPAAFTSTIPGIPAPAAIPPLPPVNPAPLLYQLAGRAAIDPWTLALALPTTQLNATLNSSQSILPSTLNPEPIVIKAGAVTVTTTVSLTPSSPTLLLMPNDTDRVQVKVPIDSGTITQSAEVNGNPLPSATNQLIGKGAYLIFAATVIDSFSAGSYTVAADLATAEVTELSLDNEAMSDVITAGLKGRISAVLQATKTQLPVASLSLPSTTTSGDLLHLDQFTFAIMAHGSDAKEGSGAIVLAAGSSAKLGSVKPPLALAGLQGLPLAAGSRACVYVAHSVLMEALLLPAVRKAGATTETTTLLAAAALQKPPSPGLLSTIAGSCATSPTIVPIYKASSDPQASNTDVDVIVDLCGLSVAVDGTAALPGDTLSVYWQQTWTQAIKYKPPRQPATLDTTLPFHFALSATRAGSMPVRLIHGNSSSELQFPPVKLGRPVVAFDLPRNSPDYAAKKSSASKVAARVREVLTGLTLPGFSAGGPALALANAVMTRAVGAGVAHDAQAYVPGDLVLVAP